LVREELEPHIRLFYTEREGFGASYRRFMMARLFWRLVDEEGVRSVCEAPCGAYESEMELVGANSLPFAVKGCEVTFINESDEVLNEARQLCRDNGILQSARFIASPLTAVPVPDDSFDLVWNFIATPTLADPYRYLLEMRRITKRFLLLVSPNAANYGYPIHRAANALSGTKDKFGSPEWFRIGYVRRHLRSLGMKMAEEGPIDIPPWPGFEGLIPLLKRLHRPSLGGSTEAQEDPETVAMAMRKYSLIEASRLPRTLKYVFAHLFYLLAEKR
jgi:hypothetical protein